MGERHIYCSIYTRRVRGLKLAAALQYVLSADTCRTEQWAVRCSGRPSRQRLWPLRRGRKGWWWEFPWEACVRCRLRCPWRPRGSRCGPRRCEALPTHNRRRFYHPFLKTFRVSRETPTTRAACSARGAACRGLASVGPAGRVGGHVRAAPGEPSHIADGGAPGRQP